MMRNLAKTFLTALISVAAAFNGMALDAPTNLVASTNLNTGVELSWKKVAGATSYIVYRYGGMGGQTGLETISVTSNGYFDVTAPVMQNVPYRVRAFGPNGAQSDYSAYAAGWRKIMLRASEAGNTLVVPSAGAVDGLIFPIECNFAWTLDCDDWIIPNGRKFVGKNGFTNVIISVKANNTRAPRRGRIIATTLDQVITNYVVQGSAKNLADTPIEAMGEPRLDPVGFTEGLLSESAAFVPSAQPLYSLKPCLAVSPISQGERAYIKFTPKRPSRLSFKWAKGSDTGALTLRKGDTLSGASVVETYSGSSFEETVSRDLDDGEEETFWIVYEKGSSTATDDRVFIYDFLVEYEPVSLRIEGFPDGVTFAGYSNPINSDELLHFRTIATYTDGSEEDVDADIIIYNHGYRLGKDEEGRTITIDEPGVAEELTISASWRELDTEVDDSVTLTLLPSLNAALDNYTLVFENDGSWIWSNSSASGSPASSGIGGAAASCILPDSGEMAMLGATVKGPTKVTFKWAVNCRAGQDLLRFYVDNQEQAVISGPSNTFHAVSYDIHGEGEHTLLWVYEKDVGTPAANEGVWIDDVRTISIPGQVMNLRVSEYTYPQMVRLHWDPVEGAEAYLIYTKPDNSTTWDSHMYVEGENNTTFDWVFGSEEMMYVGGMNFRIAAFKSSAGISVEGERSNSVHCEATPSLTISSPALMVMPANFESDPYSYQGTISVCSSFEYWTATSDSPWLKLTNTICEYSPGFASFTVTENTTGEPRVGTITVRSSDSTVVRYVTVVQHGANSAFNAGNLRIVGPTDVNAGSYADYSLEMDIDGVTLRGLTNISWKVEAESEDLPPRFYIHNYTDGNGGCPGRFIAEDIDVATAAIISANVYAGSFPYPETWLVVHVHPNPSKLAPEGVALDFGNGTCWFSDFYGDDKVLRSAQETPLFQESTLRADVTGPGVLRFDWLQPSGDNTSSLKLLVDGYEVASCPADDPRFFEQKVIIEGGEHRLEWVYYQAQPNWHEDAFGCIRNLRWDAGADTGSINVTGASKIYPRGETMEYTLARIFETEGGERISVPIAVTDRNAWSVECGDASTEECIAYDVTSSGTLRLYVPSSVTWEDTIVIGCTAEIDDEVQDRFRAVEVQPVTLNEVLDCNNLVFQGDSFDSLYGNFWRITDSDTSEGDFALSMEGGSYWSSSITATVLGAGTLTFDWKAVISGGNYDGGGYSLRVLVDDIEVWSDGDKYEGRTEWTPATIEIADSRFHTIVWEFSDYYYGDKVRRMFLDHVTWQYDLTAARPQPTGLRVEGLTDVTGHNGLTYYCYLQYSVEEDGEPTTYEVAYTPDSWTFTPVSGNAETDWYSSYLGTPNYLYVWRELEEIATGGSFKVGAAATVDGQLVTNEIAVSYTSFTSVGRAVMDNGDFTADGNAGFHTYDGDDAVWYGTFDANSKFGDSCAVSHVGDDDQETEFSVVVFGHGVLGAWCKTSSDAGDSLRVILDYDYDNPIYTISGITDWQYVSVSIPAPNFGDPEEVHEVTFLYGGNGDGVTAGDNCAWVDGVTWSGTQQRPIVDDRIYCPQVLTNGMSMAVGVNFYRSMLFGGEDGLANNTPATGDDVPGVEIFYDIPEELTDQVLVSAGPTPNSLTITTAPNLTASGTVILTFSYIMDGKPYYETRRINVYKMVPRREALDNERLFYEMSNTAEQYEEGGVYDGGGYRWEENYVGVKLSPDWFGALFAGAEGGHAVRSGPIKDGESTTLRTELLGRGTLTFNWQTWSEQFHDYLTVYVNGEPMGAISGLTQIWQTETLELSNDVNMVEWVYSKDDNGMAEGDDCGWVDNIRWTGTYYTVPDDYVDPDPYPPVIDMAALTPEGVEFQSSEQYPWYYAHWMLDDVLRSTRIMEVAGTSTLAATVTGPGLLCFDWMVANSDFNKGATLTATVDGVEQAQWPQESEAFVLQGLLLGEGTHQVEWSFSQEWASSTEVFGALRNLRWATDTGVRELAGPTNAAPGMASVEYRPCAVYEDDAGRRIEYLYPVDDFEAWSVTFGDERTRQWIKPAITEEGTLTFTVPEEVSWNDVVTITCDVMIDGEIRHLVKEVTVARIPLSEVLDCTGPLFWLENDLDAWGGRTDDAWWRITSEDTAVGDYALVIGGYLWAYSFNRDNCPAVKAMVHGAGTLTFDWRLERTAMYGNPSISTLYFYADDSCRWDDMNAEKVNASGWNTASVHVDGNSLHELAWHFYGMNSYYVDRVFLDHVTWTPDDPDAEMSVTGVRIGGPAELSEQDGSATYECYLQYTWTENGELQEGEVLFRPDEWTLTPHSEDFEEFWYYGAYRQFFNVDREREETPAGSFTVGTRVVVDGKTFTDEIDVSYPRVTSLNRAVLDAGPLGDNAIIEYYYGGWSGVFDGAHVGESCGRCVAQSDNWGVIGITVWGHGTFSFDLKTHATPDSDAFMVFTDSDSENPAVVASGDTEWTRVTIEIPEPEEGSEECQHWIELQYYDPSEDAVANGYYACVDNFTWDGTVLLPIWENRSYCPNALTSGVSEVLGVNFYRMTFGEEKEYEEESGWPHPAVGDDVPEVEFVFDVPQALQGLVTFTPGPSNNQYTVTTASNLSAGGSVGVTMRFVLNGDEYEETRQIDLVRFVSRRQALDNPQVIYEVDAPEASSGENGKYVQYWEDTIVGSQLPTEWFGMPYDGAVSNNCVRSGQIGGNQSTTLRTTLLGPGALTFELKVSSEQNYDWARIYVNGELLESVSGEHDWSTFSYELTAETNVVEWVYTKDFSADAGADCVWIDNLRWTGTYPPIPDGYVDPDAVDEPDLPEATETSRGVAYSWLSKYGIDPLNDKWETTEEHLAANGVNSVLECFVAGLDPTNGTNEFQCLITTTNGVHYISWTPDLGDERVYIIKGKANLSDPEWVAPTNSTHRFFKVEILWDK